MNIKETMVIFLLLLIVPLRSFSQAEGKVIMTNFAIVNSVTTKEIASFEVLYKGDYAIQKIPKLSIQKDSVSQREIMKVEYFLLTNSKKTIYSYFRNFADTATAVFTYKGNHPPFYKYGGWYFNSADTIVYDLKKKLEDTVIVGKCYERYRFTKYTNNNKYDFMIYCISDKDQVPVKLLRSVGRKLNKTIVRMDVCYNDKLLMYSIISYDRSYLTESERRVFSKWIH